MNKPKLSFWQIWNLSFGFLGVQIGYSLQNSNTSSIFESLGADVSHLSYFWLAAPLAGMIIQPIVGMFSDGTWTRFGRRIPYILGGALISTVALLLMPNCPVLLAVAPLAMGAFILLFMDLSFNVTMQPFRALVADMLDDSQKTRGYVVQTFLINLGAVIGAFLPLVMTWFGVSDEAVPGKVSEHIAWSYYAGGIVLLLTVLVTAFKTKEYPPKEFAEYNGLEYDGAGRTGNGAVTEKAGVSSPERKPGFIGLMRNIPKVMLQLGVTQFFSWAALFLMWTYLKLPQQDSRQVREQDGLCRLPSLRCCGLRFPAFHPRQISDDASYGRDRHRLGRHSRYALLHTFPRCRCQEYGSIYGHIQFYHYHTTDSHRAYRRHYSEMVLRFRSRRYARACRSVYAPGCHIRRFCQILGYCRESIGDA